MRAASGKQRGLIAILVMTVAGLGLACGDGGSSADEGGGALSIHDPSSAAHPDGDQTQHDGAAGAGDEVGSGEPEQSDHATETEPADHPPEASADDPATPDGDHEQPAAPGGDHDQPAGDQPAGDQPAADDPAHPGDGDQPAAGDPAHPGDGDQPTCDRAATIEHCVQEHANQCEGVEHPDLCRAEQASHCEQDAAQACAGDPPPPADGGDHPGDGTCRQEAIAHCLHELASRCEGVEHPDACHAELETTCERETAHACAGDGTEPAAGGDGAQP